MGGKPKGPNPAVTYVPPELIQNRSQERNTQKVLSEQVVGAQDNTSRPAGTILTGSNGLNSPIIGAKKTLLGQ